MADDTAALVLTLEARFDKFEKAMADAAKSVDKQTKVIEDRFSAMSTVVGDRLQSIGGRFAERAGGLGQALIALGPAGRAAAIGIGFLEVAFDATAAAAERMGQKASAIKEFATVTGLTTAEVIGLRKASLGLAVDADQVQQAFGILTTKFAELKKTGGGELADALNQVDSGLVGIVNAAPDVATKIKIIIDAFSRLTTEQRNAALRQSFGRGGFGLAEIIEKGPAFIKAWDEATAAAKKNAEQMDLLAKKFREFEALKKEVSSEWDKVFPTEEFYDFQIRKMRELREALKDINKQPTVKEKVLSAINSATKFFTPDFAGPPTQAPWATPEQMKKDAAAIEERANAEKKLAAATQEVVVGSQAEKNFMDEQADAQNSRIGQLTDEINKLKLIASVRQLTTAELAKQQRLEVALKFVQLSTADQQKFQADRRRGDAEATEGVQLHTIALKERLGVATEEELRAKNRIELVQVERQVVLTAEQEKLAALIAEKEIREKLEAQVVRASQLPGLTRLGQDFNNLGKQLDQFAVSTFGKLEDGFADIITGTKSLKDAFKDMTNSILRDLVKLALRRLLFGPVLSALGGGTGFAGLPKLAAGGPVSSGQPYIVGEHGPELFIPSVGGAVAPNSQLSGGVMNVNISLAGAYGDRVIQQIAFATTKAGMQAALAQVPRIATSAVADASRRGSFA